MTNVDPMVDERAALNREHALSEEQGENIPMLEALAIELAKTRSEAIEGRANSGIEEEWQEDEEYYEGIDDANRMQQRAWRSKPLGSVGLPSGERTTASTVFLNITRPYTDAAAARVGDMLLPTDDKAWSIQPTPIPGMAELSDGDLPMSVKKAIRQQIPNEEQAMIEEQRMLVQAKEILKEYKQSAESATKQIEDWHVECQFHAQVREVIDDVAKVGVGVLKGPVPEKRMQIAYKDGNLVITEELKPVSRRIDYWNFFPDPGCGDDIHNGGYCWERDDITARGVQDLIGMPGYFESQLEMVLKEGPFKATKEVPERPDSLSHGVRRESKNLFEIWYFHGDLDKEQLMACGCQGLEEADIPDTTLFHAQATMINNRIVYITVNPLDTGEYPYDVMQWQRREGLPWGIGVARQSRVAQDVVKGAARMMMDNAGRAGGPQLVIKQGIVEPADGITEITPWKIWLAAEDADLDHLDNAFRFVVIPMLQAELEQIVRLGLKLAEDITGIPMIMQGQMGEQSAPNTLGGMQMLQNNASSVLRRIARLYDDRLTEPHIRRYYTYLLQYGEDQAKGDFQIDARGSSALVERELQAQNIAALGQLVLNPAFGIDPKKWMQEYLKSQRLDGKRFEFDDDEWRQIVENMMQQGSQDTSLEVAKMKADVEVMKLEHMTKAKEADLSVQIMEAEKDRALEMTTEYMRREIEAMRLAGNKEVSLDQIEAKLADSAMKLRTQMKLANMSNATKAVQVATPPTEPPGRAPAGQAYQK